MALVTIRQLARGFRRRLEFGDFLFFFYLIVFIRQFFWGVEVWTAWVLTIPLAIAALCVWVSTRESESRRSGVPFWVVVASPLVVVYLLRVAFPDSSFDVWALRLFHAERGLRGFLYLPGEFFPTSAPFNPTPDMLTGIFRHLLGYRAGTIVNLFVLLWSAQIVDRLLRPYVSNDWARATGVLVIMLAEHLLFEVNNYMVDLLALPLMLEATQLTLNADTWLNERRNLARVAFLLGASGALKLTNLAMAAPLVMLCGWRVLSARPFDAKRLATTTLATFIAFAAPLLPFALYIYTETGSPVFPYYNWLFHSPYFPPITGWDSRWGAHKTWEVPAWPILIFFEPGRTSELGVYSGRLSAAIVVAIGGLIFFWHRARFRALCLIVLVAALLWSITLGYIRYALYLEVLAGVILVIFALLVAEKTARHARSLRAALAAPILAILAAQSALACSYVARAEWSMRQTIFQNYAGYVRESKYIFRDRSIRALLAPRERELFDQVEVWVVSGETTAGLMSLLNRRAPFINVRTYEYFVTHEGREKYARALEGFDGRRMFSLSMPSDFGDALSNLRARGLEAGQVREVELPFYSPSFRVYVYMFEVKRTGLDVAATVRERTCPRGPLPEDGYRAEISPPDPLPKYVKPGERLVLFVRVRNTGGSVWPSLGRERGEYGLALRARWLDAEGTPTFDAAVRTPIFFDLAPGEDMPLPLTLRAPDLPGDYVLETDMIQEGVTHFKDRGSAPLRLNVRVSP